MTTRLSNRKCLELFYDTVIKGDQETANDLLHPAFTVYEADGLPYAGVFQGKDA